MARPQIGRPRPIAIGNPVVQLRLPWLAPPGLRAPAAPRDRHLTVDGRVFPIDITRHRWARRYLLRLTEAGRLRLTVPRSASIAGGLAFAHGETDWILREWARIQATTTWTTGTRVWWRGESVELDCRGGHVAFAAERLLLTSEAADVRAVVQRHWRRVAAAELPDRCRALAALHGLTLDRVSVRDQRSRWGSCSARRTVALNWRLVQMPPDVADYVILHELAHLEQPNHSRRFWRKVASICPEWRPAERWLRRHGRELM